ncbi:hypothetical protein ADN00_15675 [Ornatilinea apprima]|uniref:Gp28/Gp37-like domain-containing protein n=1 Tax=Ornatilinea apprima TaxID=1134406 RepID=A0A0P6WQC1_9CHLR|nr:siphovirus ReqiPepy6 Gp37-like family protein [Ornatilinea apprima]KPL72255.1 hypothetical protein ADN00_15675 [Ornatilinea apprima]
MSAEYRIYSRNPDLTRNSEITRYKRLEFISRFCLGGSWTLSGEGDLPLSVNQGIIIVRNDVEVFSGVVQELETAMDAESFLSRSWTFKGKDDLARIGDRVAVPDPVGWNFSTAAYDTRTGLAEAVILEFVDYNCGPSAIERRRLPNFQVGASSGLGLTVTGNARFDNLLTLIYNLAQMGGVGYRVRYDSTLGRLVFEVFEPTDRTTEVKFSADFGNLQSFKHKLRAPKANYAIVLGQGEGSSRSNVCVYDNNSISTWGLVEMMKDQRNEPDSAKLQNWGEAELEKKKEQEGYTIVPNELGGVGFTYGVDYFLGDLVSVADEAVVLQETVTEVKFSIDEDGEEKIVPTIGSLKDIPLSNTFERIEDLTDRVNQIETSQ